MKTVRPTNWDEVRRRVEVVSAAIEQGGVRSPDEERRILKNRAQELARELVDSEATADTLEVIEFELAGEHYALPLAQVRTVSALKELTPVPCTPSFVSGIINLRGEIHTVVDLKRFFDLPGKGITDLNKIIIVQHADMQLGILADVIRGVRHLRPDEMDSALPTLTGIRADYLRGVTSDRLVVLDAARILSDSRLLVDEEVPSDSPSLQPASP